MRFLPGIVTPNLSEKVFSDGTAHFVYIFSDVVVYFYRKVQKPRKSFIIQRLTTQVD